MKKLMMFMTVLVMTLALGACGSQNADKIADTIEKGGTLTDSDYKVMNDYVADGIDEAIKVVEKAISEGDINPDADQDLDKKYPHYRLFMEKLVSDNKLSDSNKEKMQRLIGLALTTMGSQQGSSMPEEEIKELPDSIK